MMLRRALFCLLITCVGCSAQSPTAAPVPSTGLSPELTRQVERHVRAQYSLPPDVKLVVGSLRPSDFANYDALTVRFVSANQNKSFDFLLSHDKKTLFRMTRFDLTTDPYVEIMKKIDVQGRPSRGNKDAKVTVVNYDDFECGFCARMHQTIFPTLFKEYGDRVLFIYKDYPLEDIHPWAVHAAVNANCLAAQSGDAFWDYADYLHANQQIVSAGKDLPSAETELDRLAMQQAQSHKLDEPRVQMCVRAQDEKAVRASIQEGDRLGVDATPTMFVNGQKLDGAVPAQTVRLALDQALAEAGAGAPNQKAAAALDKAPPGSAK